MVNNNLKEGCEVIDQGNTLLLQTPTGRIFKLKRRQIRVDEILLNELFATEITNLYKASIELKEGNERLESMNNRMKNLNDTITRVTIEKEVLNAKSMNDRLQAKSKYPVPDLTAKKEIALEGEALETFYDIAAGLSVEFSDKYQGAPRPKPSAQAAGNRRI